MGFKNYINESQELNEFESRMFVLANLMEEDLNSLNESSAEMLAEGIKDKLDKAGLKLHKGKGILDYIKNFTKGTGKLMLALFKGDTKKAKEILKTIEKEDILDFLYKLDLGTLHLVTGPLHTIDAWTGWDLSVKMKDHMQKASGVWDQLKDALHNVKQKIQVAFGKDVGNKLTKHVNAIEQAIV